VEAKVFHAERQTDMTKLADAFRNFAKTPENELTHGVFQSKISYAKSLIQSFILFSY
jgi:hypothetical protein